MWFASIELNERSMLTDRHEISVDSLCKAFVAAVVLGVGPSCSQLASPREHAEAWVGSSIDEYRQMRSRPEDYGTSIGWKEKTYQLPNGNTDHVFISRPECFYHFEVDGKGTIIAYKLEGSRCY